MSIAISPVPQSNSYYRPQNAAGGVASPSQNREIKDKSDPDYVCQTCKERKYQDKSNDPGVSFKSPGRISPGASASVVASHEQEHVTNEQAKARAEGRRVISQSVVLQYALCPECNRTYVSGGKTRTITASDNNHSNVNGNRLDVRV